MNPIGTNPIRLVAFGGTKTIVGARNAEFHLDKPCSTSHLLDELCKRYPDLERQRQGLRLAVNGQFVTLTARVSPGDEVALIPPVAGG